jgi:DNA-binding MarR family transcriptional regulator
MTDAPAVYGEFGQTLTFAHRTLTAGLRAHLAQRGTEPETWYALKSIATHGPAAARDAVVDDLEGPRDLDAGSAGPLLARLASEDLIKGDQVLDLTEAGETEFRDLRDYVSGLTVKLLSQFDLRDVETTVRTLQAVTSRAAAS